MIIWLTTDGKVFMQHGWQTAHTKAPLLMEIDNDIWHATNGMTWGNLKQPVLDRIKDWITGK